MSGNIRITQLDGKLPNLALMRLSCWHRERGDKVYFTRTPYRRLDEPEYSAVYASAIFDYSQPHVERLRLEFPGAVIGGTASKSNIKVEDIIGNKAGYSYEDYPDFSGSLGFTQRGCRLSCKFCVVPGKEGKPQSVATIADIWRGEGHPKHIHLLDNDFFGQEEGQWRARIAEIKEGSFKVCFNQGLNVRMMTREAARALASINYRDDGFTTKRLYTAWDNLKDEEIFFRGVDVLEDAGIPSSHLMAYMLIGFDKKETWERLFQRFNKMTARGIRPYPMVFGDKMKKLPIGGHNARIAHRTLSEFQRWVIRKAYNFVPFEDYNVNAKGRMDSAPNLFDGEAA
jgi:hypothetical protein